MKRKICEGPVIFNIYLFLKEYKGAAAAAGEFPTCCKCFLKKKALIDYQTRQQLTNKIIRPQKLDVHQCRPFRI